MYNPSFFCCVLHIRDNVQFRLRREVYQPHFFFSKSACCLWLVNEILDFLQ